MNSKVFYCFNWRSNIKLKIICWCTQVGSDQWRHGTLRDLFIKWHWIKFFNYAINELTFIKLYFNSTHLHPFHPSSNRLYFNVRNLLHSSFCFVTNIFQYFNENQIVTNFVLLTIPTTFKATTESSVPAADILRLA